MRATSLPPLNCYTPAGKELQAGVGYSSRERSLRNPAGSGGAKVVVTMKKEEKS